jgi:stringent starvation protein B
MMTPRRPYFIRAMYEWISDNHLTPYIAVNAELPNVNVPQNYIKDGRIVLDISLNATNKLRTGNDAVEFDARFGGKVTHVFIPINAVLAIYAKENNLGMIFSHEDIENYEFILEEEDQKSSTTNNKQAAHLKLIHGKDDDKEE